MAAPKAPLLDSAGKKAKDVTLEESVFSAELKLHVVHETVRAEMNAHRSGTRAAKSRGLAADIVQSQNFFTTMIEAVQKPSSSGLTWCNDTPHKIMAAVDPFEKSAAKMLERYRYTVAAVGIGMLLLPRLPATARPPRGR